MAWTNVNKPSATAYTNTNTQGKQQYDQSDIAYDDSSVFYDSVNQVAWSNISKPVSTTWTNIAKPV